MHVLITGFEPFGGETINPSWEVARALDGETVAGARLRALRLPCRFGEASRVLADALASDTPRLVIGLGQASKRHDVSVERVAINVDDAPMPDNGGDCPIDRAVVADAPVAYFSGLPIKRIVATLRAAGIPSSVSQTAGTFVCNHTFYSLAHLLATRYPATKGGFIHLPMLPQQAAAHPGLSSLSLDTMVAGIRAAVQVTLQAEGDLKLGAGALE
jgi:pyroglutamyl-peptidase